MIGTLLFHALAATLTDETSPRVSKTRIDRVGRTLRPIDVREARRSMQWLMRLRIGTCLSRSLCVAARLRGSEIVIGFRRDARGFAAHAWVEVSGVRLMPAEATQEFREIARLP